MTWVSSKEIGRQKDTSRRDNRVKNKEMKRLGNGEALERRVDS
jgi:hypothetical protein